MTELNHTPQPGQLKVLLLGDTCTDQYIIGEVERISPEAPVPIIKIESEYQTPGMAANVLRNLKKLNCYVLDAISRADIFKTRYIDKKSKQQLLRVDSDTGAERWHGHFEPQAAEWVDLVVVSDYDKGFLWPADIEKIISIAKTPVFIDTKKRDLASFSGDNVFVKINEDEYRNRKSDAQNMIVTMGGKGAKLIINGEEKLFPVKETEVVDVCGCGDTFLAAVAFEYVRNGHDINKAIDFANKAGSITVQHRGNYAPTLEEIENA